MLRKTLIISYAVLFVAFAAPFVYSVLCSAQEKSRDAEQKNEQQLHAELERSIRLLDQGTSLEMDMHSYLVGVVAAEMPALFPHEALKAQAVAARTYAMYCAGLERHENADVCSYSGCCQAWMSQDALRQRWGADYDKYSSMVSAAVKETAGEYLGYEGQPVLLCRGYGKQRPDMERHPLSHLRTKPGDGGKSPPAHKPCESRAP